MRYPATAFNMSVHPSVRIYQLGSHWTNFREIWYWKLSWKPAEKIKIWLQSGKNVVHFTRRTWYVLLLQATLNRHKRDLFDCNSMALLVRPPVRIHARLPLDTYTWKMIMESSMKIFREIPNLVKVGQKHRALYMKNWVRLIVSDNGLSEKCSLRMKCSQAVYDRWRYKYYANAPQCYVISILLVLLVLHLDLVLKRFLTIVLTDTIIT